MVAGKWQVVDGQLLNVDVEQLIVEHSALAKKLAIKLHG